MTTPSQHNRSPHRASTAVRRLLALGRVGCCVGLLLGGPGVAQPFFTDVTDEIDVQLFESRSIAFGDYDNDGWPDLFLAQNMWNNAFQRRMDRPAAQRG